MLSLYTCPLQSFAFLAAVFLLLSPTPAYPQSKSPGEDADSIVPLEAAVQILRNVELPLGSSKLKVSSIEYAQQGSTAYLLPVWVVAKVEMLNIKSSRWEELSPDQPLPTKVETPAPRIRIQIANLLSQEDTRAAVEKRLRDHLASGEGLKPELIKLRFHSFNPSGFRITLVAPASGGDGGEVALSRSVVIPPSVAEDSGRVMFDVRPEAVASLQAANAEPVLLRDAYLKLTGQRKVRFEQQQYLANFQVVQAAVTSLQNDLKSTQPSGTPAPEVFVQVQVGGEVEGRAAVSSAFSQYLVGAISVREGASVNAAVLTELSERVLGRILSQLEISHADDAKRVAVMLGNTATLSATVGEIKNLATASRQEREQRLKAVLDEKDSRRSGKNHQSKGSIGIRYGVIGGELSGAYTNATEETRDALRKQELDTLNRGLDELAKHFDGRLPTLTGIRFDQTALDESMKVMQFEWKNTVFTKGWNWSQHDWTGIKLTTTVPAVSSELLVQQLAAAQGRYDSFQKLIESPKRLEEFEAANLRIRELEKQLGEQRRRNEALGTELESRLKGYKEVPVWLGAERHTLSAKKRNFAVVFTPDGKTLATAGDDGTKLWDASTGAALIALKGATDGSYCVAFSPDGKLIAAGCENGAFRVWDVATGDDLATFKGDAHSLWNVRFSPDGKTLAGSCLNSVRFWDIATGMERGAIEGAAFSANSVAFSSDWKTLAVLDSYRKVTLWDVSSRVKRQPFDEGSNPDKAVYCVAFTPDGKQLACGGNDGTVKFWDLATNKESRKFHGQSNSTVYSLAFSPDGTMLACGYYGDGTISLFDVDVLSERGSIRTRAGEVISIAFSRDGKTLASAGLGTYGSTGFRSGTKLWDIQTYLVLGRPKPEEKPATSNK